LLRAIRWSSADRPLYEGHLAVVTLVQGKAVDDLDGVIARLEEAPCGQGYGRFVLGMLCSYAERPSDAQRYLRGFVSRTRAGRPALVIALESELALAEKRLKEFDVN